MNKISPTVKNIIIINVIMFALDWLLYRLNGINLNGYLSLYYFGIPLFKVYQIATHFFMHANIYHIAFNMFSLYSIGSLLERFWGSKRMLNFYLISGIGAALFYMLFQASIAYINYHHVFLNADEYNFLLNRLAPMVGASGAVFAVFTAVSLLFPNSEFFIFFIPVPIKAKYLLPAIVIISIYLGLMNYEGDHIAHFGHLGGVLMGYILTKYYNRDKKRFY